MSKKVVKRREVRQVVVQTLYQMISAHKDLDINEAVAYALEAGVFPEEGYEGIDNDYFYELIEGVRSKETEIDKLIEPYLTGWSLDRIARIDLIILRVAFYEIFFVSKEEVPNNVAADEAIELSKFFSDDKSRQFVSGVVAKVLDDTKAENE
ncbi:transcription antitermination factor NusB [Ruoffia tabacinasalis]|uniref:transcription antitermination factor NusB n=1 Tax=Ruoffia tabacinasalis TaxID=87458 RepID=UPI003F9E7BA6